MEGDADVDIIELAQLDLVDGDEVTVSRCLDDVTTVEVDVRVITPVELSGSAKYIS